MIGQGYGSSVPKGKYEGFGSTPINRGDNLVTQVRPNQNFCLLKLLFLTPES